MPAKKPPKDGPHKMRLDVAETAYRVMLEATGQAPKTRSGEGEKNPEAAKRGAKGGTSRAQTLSKTEKSDVGRHAASIRWKKKP